ncbi:hypothetical protein CYV19_00105 [Natronobacterium gregoryi SP2]|uniref:Uncharacterized protein n=1 Tax=Natronobacterium gregoryi (strain ATCC 43098 / DSM 3393 / CCM 3738 / CIP 104747 / IAM 13177 / JCM 8860 / NBRC 102187 / NCIMB 2189 / SP2) TaxID=797304 RepID=L9XNG6_NATGS|nr:hypothetical protein C490_16374 [Natronobacterium gregoryi SP2]PLK22118.1 hypothetical protein CYV19_00105 [Natronobacterium gregoryi SP2]
MATVRPIIRRVRRLPVRTGVSSSSADSSGEPVSATDASRETLVSLLFPGRLEVMNLELVGSLMLG